MDGDATGPITLTDEHIDAALDELLDQQSALTRTLLGGAQSEPRPGTEWLITEN